MTSQLCDVCCHKGTATSDWLSGGALQYKSDNRLQRDHSLVHLQTNHSDYAQYITSPHPRVTPWNIDAMVCDVIGCYGYDANTAAAAAQAATTTMGLVLEVIVS